MRTNTVRLSIGIEPADVLIKDIKQALALRGTGRDQKEIMMNEPKGWIDDDIIR